MSLYQKILMSLVISIGSCSLSMAAEDDIAALVVDNGSGMCTASYATPPAQFYNNNLLLSTPIQTPTSMYWQAPRNLVIQRSSFPQARQYAPLGYTQQPQYSYQIPQSLYPQYIQKITTAPYFTQYLYGYPYGY